MPEKAVAVAANNYSTCALTGLGRVYCWGLHMSGELGVGDASTLATCLWNDVEVGCSPTPRQVLELDAVVGLSDAGATTMCALLDDGAVRCWGRSGDGELGIGTSTGPEQCGPIDYVVSCSSMPAASVLLTPLAVALGYGCITTDDGQLWCWGSNDYGRLGLGSADGPMTCGSGSCSVSPNRVLGLDDVEMVEHVGSWAHSCALSAEGSVWCWGLNGYGELGISSAEGEQLAPTPISAEGPFVAIGASLQVGCAVDASGDVYCWGANGVGQLGIGSFDGPDECGGGISRLPCSRAPVAVTPFGSAVEVRPGESHVCALTVSDEIYCWGWNEHGQLGDGSTAQSPVPVKVQL